MKCSVVGCALEATKESLSRRRVDAHIIPLCMEHDRFTVVQTGRTQCSVPNHPARFSREDRMRQHSEYCKSGDPNCAGGCW